MNFINKEYFYSLSKNEFFEEWLKHEKIERNLKLYDFIAFKFNFRDVTDESIRQIKIKIAKWSSKIYEKWYKAGKSKERFLTKYKQWLDHEDFKIQVNTAEPQPSTSSGRIRLGRPQKEFQDSSFRTKKRRVEQLVQVQSFSELITASEISARLSGQRNKAKAIRDVNVYSETAGLKISTMQNPRQLSRNEALAYYIDSKCTTHSYQETRKWSLKVGHDVFPSYYSLSKAKKECYPSDQNIFVTETRADVNLQAILNKTAERLIEAQSEVILSVCSHSPFTLISKWGCDGSSGHSTYKQKFDNLEATDEYLFVYSFVPIRLVQNNNIVWQNPRPSSTMFCRPIKFIFPKETTEFTKVETKKILEDIQNLCLTYVNLGDIKISVKHELLLTMTDGKICNALTETLSAQKCFICGATPKMMNSDPSTFKSNPDCLGFGLSTLHAWIRCFECCLHISYRLDIKKWQARSAEEKASVKQRSKCIQRQFKEKMGLIVDQPKPGFGSTNDGNTARRFFGNPALSAEITGLDFTLIHNFNILLRTLSSGFEINLKEFDRFCCDTRKQYLSLYSWYYMPATVHKILVHSKEVIENAIVPIGQLSEEAQEARNKDCRRFREHNTRKRSRIATNRDLLSMLLITSDPLINSLREIPKKKTDVLCPEVRRLLVSASIKSQFVSCQTYFYSPNDVVLSDSLEYSDEEEQF